MPFQPVPNTAQVDMIYSQHGQLVENVYHVGKASAWNATDLTSLAANMIAWWQANLRPITSDSLILSHVEAKDLTTDGGATASVSCTTNCGGQLILPGMPGNVTVAISLKTGLAGRSFRGRKYHLGLTEDQVVGNVLTAGLAATLDTAYTALKNTLTGLGWSWVVVSRRYNGVLRPSGITTPITSIEVNSDIDSQRRRLQGRGT